MIRWLGVLLGLAAVASAVGCTGSEGSALPNGGQLTQRAAEALRQVETLRFDLKVDGAIPGISIGSARGQLTKAGNVQGSAVLTALGQPTETDFVIVGDTLYLKGPTGGFQKLPLAFAAGVYDPSKILDANLGLPALVANATEPAVQAKETVDGTETYHVKAKFAKNNLGVLLPGTAASTDLPGEMWITTAEPNRPIMAKVDVPATGGATGGTVTIRLSEFDGPVTITPPS
ncbi:MAG TPA: LppX_LprAFG lipoprotein [Pseudonocardiaceae bacterium]